MPVHAYPNAALNTSKHMLPVRLADMSGLLVDVSWTYNAGNSIRDTTGYAGLEAASVNANVCLDMFLSPNATSATSTTKTSYEVMVWLGRLGAATDPLGFELGSLDTRTINGTTLYAPSSRRSYSFSCSWCRLTNIFQQSILRGQFPWPTRIYVASRKEYY